MELEVAAGSNRTIVAVGCGFDSYVDLDGACDTCPHEWYDGWWIVACFGLNTLLGGFFKSHSMMEMLNAGVKVPVALIAHRPHRPAAPLTPPRRVDRRGGRR